MMLANAPIGAIALENPVGIISTVWRKPDQYIQPWQFGHGETKKTGLWLQGLSKLVPTDVVDGREARIHKMAPGPNRSKERSRTYQGIADAMSLLNAWQIARAEARAGMLDECQARFSAILAAREQMAYLGSHRGKDARAFRVAFKAAHNLVWFMHRLASRR
jgi:hypothetical protein